MIDFSNEIDPFRSPSDDFITVLRWILGDPIGKTDWPDGSSGTGAVEDFNKLEI